MEILEKLRLDYFVSPQERWFVNRNVVSGYSASFLLCLEQEKKRSHPPAEICQFPLQKLVWMWIFNLTVSNWVLVLTEKLIDPDKDYLQPISWDCCDSSKYIKGNRGEGGGEVPECTQVIWKDKCWPLAVFERGRIYYLLWAIKVKPVWYWKPLP